MGRALPDDEAIEAKMVTKAIERAQTTVEQRNAEIRKNVLKYDEVMNEQRKVIYQRRDQILERRRPEVRRDGVPRRGHRRADRAPTAFQRGPTEWDLDGLAKELRPTGRATITEAELERCHGRPTRCTTW